MSKYTVEAINNNVATIKFSNNYCTFIELDPSWSEAELDNIVAQHIPGDLKTGAGVPSFLSVGDVRTAALIPVTENPTWMNNRLAAYGNPESQIEYITENGLEAWQAHVAKIKADNPKT